MPRETASLSSRASAELTAGGPAGIWCGQNSWGKGNLKVSAGRAKRAEGQDSEVFSAGLVALGQIPGEKSLLSRALVLSNLPSGRTRGTRSSTLSVSRHLVDVCLQKGRALPRLSITARGKHFSACLNGKWFVCTGGNSRLSRGA